ncbi:MAG: hypothetical protein HUJ91_01070 [Bacteroidales bacterium]|nr:hypothetical protein [Bacteroidales bacterium]
MPVRVNIRRLYPFFIFVTVVLYALAWRLTGDVLKEYGALSLIEGSCCLWGLCYMILRAANKFSLGANYSAPLLLAALLLSFPGIVPMCRGYIGAVTATLAFLGAMKYFSGELDNDIAFLSSMLMSVAVMIYPPLLWVAVVVFVTNLRPSEDRPRYIAMSFTGFLLPATLMAIWIAFHDGVRAVLPASSWLLQGMVAVNIHLGTISAARAAKILVLMVLFGAAVANYFTNSARYSVSRSRSLLFTMIYALATFAVLVLFSGGGMTLSCATLLPPVVLCIYDYLTCDTGGRITAVSLLFITIATILEYVMTLVG